MARLPSVPSSEIRTKLKGKILYTVDRGVIVAKAWPRKRPGKGTPAQQENRAIWKEWIAGLKTVAPIEIVNAKMIATGSGYHWHDVIARASLGRMAEWQLVIGAEMPDFDVQSMLNQLGAGDGSIIVLAGGVWVWLPPGDADQVLTMSAAINLPVWATAPATGLNELTGDVTAGPGAGSQPATLSTTGVTPGTYLFSGITVDAKGRITAASNGTPTAYINQLTGDVTAGPGSGAQTSTLANTAVTPGSYTLTSLTVDAKGRITAASNGSTSGTVTAGKGTIRLKTDVSTVSLATGTAEQDMKTFVVPANTLSANGMALQFRGAGTFAANAHNKTWRLYFGSLAASKNNAQSSVIWWEWDMLITRISAGHQLVTGRVWFGSTTANTGFNIQHAYMTEDETANITLKTTGQTATSGAGDIVDELFTIELLQAA